MQDYTVIPKELIDMLDKAGCPVSEEQGLLITGWVAGLQANIESKGLSQVVENMRQDNGST